MRKRSIYICAVGILLAGCQKADTKTQSMPDTKYSEERIMLTTDSDEVSEKKAQKEIQKETEPEIIRSDPPTPLEEFVEYYWGLHLSGEEKEVEKKIISRHLTMEEAASLGEYETLSHLKDLERGRYNAQRMVVAAAELNDDGQEDIIEYCINDELGGSTGSNSLTIYMKNGTGYERMYSQPLFDRGQNLRVIAYEGQKYLEMEEVLEKNIYWLEDWKPKGKAHIKYSRRAKGGRLVFCEEITSFGEAGNPASLWTAEVRCLKNDIWTKWTEWWNMPRENTGESNMDSIFRTQDRPFAVTSTTTEQRKSI